METETLTPDQIFMRLRQRVLAGETLSREETTKVLDTYRDGRLSAAENASKPKAAKKDKAPARSPEDLLKGLLKKS